MLKAKDRVAVAVDVLQQLAAGKFRATQGVYLKAEFNPYKDDPSFDHYNGDLQSFLRKQGHCEVCARGALLASKALLFDEVPCGKYKSVYEAVMQESLKIFGKKQAYLIEYAYEGKNVHEGDEEENPVNEILSQEEMESALRFYRAHSANVSHLLRSIMVNLIENRGTFKP